MIFSFSYIKYLKNNFRLTWMQIKVLLFAEARDLAEADSIEIELATSETTKSEIFDAVKRAASCLEQILDTCNLAYNHVSPFCAPLPLEGHFRTRNNFNLKAIHW